MTPEVAPEVVRRETLDRRALRSELLAVLSVSFFASAAFAVLSYAALLVRRPEAAVTVIAFPTRADVFVITSQLLGRTFELAPVALVAHLIARTDGSMSVLGFDLDRRWRDAARGSMLAVAGLAFVTSYVYVVARFDVDVRSVIPVSPNAHVSVVAVVIVTSIVAGVSEEVVVNAYMLHRLGGLGWAPGRALLASALLRGSYHLYQGWQGAAGTFVVGLVLGWLYQRTRRVMPLVIAHAAYDIFVFLGYLVAVGRFDWVPG